jgi:hypothetical protein
MFSSLRAGTPQGIEILVPGRKLSSRTRKTHCKEADGHPLTKKTTGRRCPAQSRHHQWWNLCARARTHTQMPHRRSPSPIRAIPLCCCQIKAWKAGHTGERAAESLGNLSKAIEYHMQHLTMARRWATGRERARRRGNSATRTSRLGTRRGARGTRRRVQVSWGLFQGHRTVRDCKGGARPGARDRAGEGGAYESLGIAYRSLGDFSKAIEYHAQQLAIAKEVGELAGVGRA